MHTIPYKLLSRCPICKKQVESTVNFQLLSTSEEEYLALNVRRFIAHFQNSSNFTKYANFLNSCALIY